MASPKRLRELSYEELMALMGEAIKTPRPPTSCRRPCEEEPGLLDRFEGVHWLDLIHRRDRRC